MAKEVTLTDVRSEAMTVIRMLREGTIDLSTAKGINSLLDTIILSAKTQVDFLNSIPKHLKDQITDDQLAIISSTFVDSEQELEKTLQEIEQKNREPYQLTK